MGKKLPYPVSLPIQPIEVKPNLDVLLLELPPRYIPMMPNGLGYVNNILKSASVNVQVIDTSIILYHKFHSERLLKGKRPKTPNGVEVTKDPWEIISETDWQQDDFVGFIWPDMLKLIGMIKEMKPKIVGVSLNGFNRLLSKRFLAELKRQAPEVTRMVGGYDCLYENMARSFVEEFDYIVMSEAELTLAPLVQRILKGECVKDTPGIISRFDSPERKYEPGPMPEDLDQVSFPQYEWIDRSYYQTYNRSYVVPISASRGCNWGKCRFCAECFPFRKRVASKVVDEIEWWTKLGLSNFHFNESDVNGDIQNLYDICSGVIDRNLKVTLMGQLRVDRRNTPEYFQHLAKAGFKHLRFGVDGWSENVLKLQRKGYLIEHVKSNLKSCHAAGIFTTVNMVIGVPGETDTDVEEMIENVKELKDCIDLVESFNTLILAPGSEYYKEPENYKIFFRDDSKEKIYKDFPPAIPPSKWYSTDPYIDENVRVERVNRLLEAFYDSGVKLAPYPLEGVKRIKAEREKGKKR